MKKPGHRSPLCPGIDRSHFLPCTSHISCGLIDYLDECSHCFLSSPPPPEPMHGPRRLEVVDIQSTQVTMRWEPLGYNVTRCHSYNLTVQYRSKVQGGKEETQEEVCYDTQSRDPQHTIHNLTPFTNLSVKLVLRNPEGVMESKELQVQTDEDGECGRTNPSLRLSNQTASNVRTHPRARGA